MAWPLALRLDPAVAPSAPAVLTRNPVVPNNFPLQLKKARVALAATSLLLWRPRNHEPVRYTPVIELKNVHKRFEQRPYLAQRLLALAGKTIDRRTVHAVNGVDLSLQRGEVVGLVGESGCGKSTLGRIVAGLPGQTEGELLYQGRSVKQLHGADKLAYTLGVQMIFQDPQASLNPRQCLR